MRYFANSQRVSVKGSVALMPVISNAIIVLNNLIRVPGKGGMLCRVRGKFLEIWSIRI